MRQREQQTKAQYQRMIEELEESHQAELKDASSQKPAAAPQPKRNKPVARNRGQSDISGWNPIGAKDWEKTIQENKSRFGSTKLNTVWRFVVDGSDKHEVTLVHNTYQQSGKSKRVLTVDGDEKFNEKSDTKEFYFMIDHHSCQVVIREGEKQGTFDYQLYVDKMPFEDIRREFYIEMQRQRAE